MIWFDITEIKNWQGHHTGIQRVIAKIGKNIAGNEDVSLCYFDSFSGGFQVIDYDFETEVRYEAENSSTSMILKPKIQKILNRFKDKAPSRLKSNVKRAIALGSTGHNMVNFHQGDTLFIPGAFWIYSLDQLAQLKREGNIRVAGIMYDLVPLVTPQFTAEVTIAGFTERFIRALDLFDYWFAISENTKKDMIAQAHRKGLSIDPSKIEVIRLGVDNNNPKESDRKEVSGLLSDQFALFVSTIEARKNQTLVYQAVKRLQDQGRSHLPIVLVGKHGWLSDDIIYILKKDTTIAKRLIWLDRVDDRSLRWLYANCAFTIYPSYYEGWGLPVAESLAMGKVCIASNSSSIPEVAGDIIEYFSPYSTDELSELMVRYSDKEYRAKRTEYLDRYVAPSWEECSSRVLSSLRFRH